MAATMANPAHRAAVSLKSWQTMLQQAHKTRAMEINCQSSSDQGTGIPVKRTKGTIKLSKMLARIWSWKKGASWG